jgi:hypothetical protein
VFLAAASLPSSTGDSDRPGVSGGRSSTSPAQEAGRYINPPHINQERRFFGVGFGCSIGDLSLNSSRLVGLVDLFFFDQGHQLPFARQNRLEYAKKKVKSWIYPESKLV